MREHHAFGCARGAGSKTHKCRVLDSRRERLLRIFQARKTQTIRAGFFQCDGFAGIGCADAFVEYRAQRRLGDHVIQFIHFHLVMNRHDHRTAAERRERANDKRASVARSHADALAGLHAKPVELAAQRLDLAPERLVIQRAAGINDGGAVGPIPRGGGKRFKNIHWKNLPQRRGDAEKKLSHLFANECNSVIQ